jgi:hypothetical protein
MISTATLDRYLQSMGQRQNFGIQYMLPTDGTVTQEPYNRTHLSDAIRAVSPVPDLDAQNIRLKELGRSGEMDRITDLAITSVYLALGAVQPLNSADDTFPSRLMSDSR